MGAAVSNCCAKHFLEPAELRLRLRIIEEELKEMRREKEEEEKIFASEWRKQQEEVARLRRMEAAAEEQRVRSLERELAAAAAARKEKEMKEEHLRGAAIEKWKQLYLAIKKELDELLQRTGGEKFLWASEHGLAVESLQRELRAKEEAVEGLEAKLAASEKEAARREREVDILRQSLRILSSRQKNRGKRSTRRALGL
ncbi:hypothetical protein AXF42_Ash000848 [Apostasia shenzhenica]|uniref:Uncharacterized protein n=1 Tax=Apostasia shenzhenica TaxID=1088818 RepID=A0A2I0AT80_9ASPA|nr:hypothetical protein AXF42_Ash000848 [Apostasia shenzhenica]